MSRRIEKVDVCIGNLDKGTEWVIERLKEEFPDLKGQRWGCLGNCGECYKRPFLLAEDRWLYEAATKEELLEKIRPDLNIVDSSK
ncbi:DUF1450 domain-containing protein [Tumebacillus lipolyticus]|uniref:DUF1450 domain-containing protein n=1 Tax=Tumebacillus lipolyticus TaxID=1280370 RepID=A0ABW5A379_9BACL